MPSPTHAAFVELVRAAADALCPALANFDGTSRPFVAPARLRDATADFTEATAVERRADLLLLAADDSTSAGMLVEVQLRYAERKLYTIPFYQTAARARYQCPIVPVVVTPSRSLEGRLSTPLDLGGGNFWRPLVVGPASILRIRDWLTAANSGASPHLAVLVALLTAGDPDDTESVQNAWTALQRMDDERVPDYIEILWMKSSGAARSLLEALMKHQKPRFDYQMPVLRELIQEGRDKALQEGRQEGLQEGRQEGLQEGRELGARASALEFARQLLGSAEASQLAALDSTDAIRDAVVARVKRD